VLMVGLHAFITSNVPMGVPLEWNVMVVYGGFALFWAHPDVRLADLGSMPLAAFLVVALLVVPIAGNLFPKRISFLLAMRYYAGNWPYSVWLFRGDSYRKLDRLTTSAGGVYEQLARFYDRPTGIGLVGKVMGFRLMHLHGRALPALIPKAVDRLEDYEYFDGAPRAAAARGAGAMRVRGGRAALHLRRAAADGPPHARVPHRRREDRPPRSRRDRRPRAPRAPTVDRACFASLVDNVRAARRRSRGRRPDPSRWRSELHDAAGPGAPA